MKILHCCLANFYIDNYGYQENIMPKMHKLQGHEVQIVASTETFINNKNLGYIKPSKYLTKEGIIINRIPYVKYLPLFITKKLRIYSGLSSILNDFHPDIIFLHDVQFISVKEIVNYCKKNKVIVYADCHTDFVNSARNWISKNILHKIIYKWCANIIEPYTRKFYGVLPLRVDFLRKVYKIPENKLDLLVMGADDSQFDFNKKNSIRSRFRKEHNISEKDFLVVTGGKIDSAKNIHILLQAISEINNENIKIVFFGSIKEDIKNEILKYIDDSIVKYLGWLDSNQIYDVLLSSDLAIYPGTHSVLWEQSIGVGLPCILKRWKGMEHFDVGGNCIFIDEINAINIKEKILLLYNDSQMFKMMKDVSMNIGANKFQYSKISKYAINQFN